MIAEPKKDTKLTSVLVRTAHVTRPWLIIFVLNELFTGMDSIKLAHKVGEFVTQEFDGIRYLDRHGNCGLGYR